MWRWGCHFRRLGYGAGTRRTAIAPPACECIGLPLNVAGSHTRFGFRLTALDRARCTGHGCPCHRRDVSAGGANRKFWQGGLTADGCRSPGRLRWVSMALGHAGSGHLWRPLVAGRRPVGAGRGPVGLGTPFAWLGRTLERTEGAVEGYDLFRGSPDFSGIPIAILSIVAYLDHRRGRAIRGSLSALALCGCRRAVRGRGTALQRPGQLPGWPLACGTTIRRWSPGSPWAGCLSRNTLSSWCRPSWPACGCCF